MCSDLIPSLDDVVAGAVPAEANEADSAAAVDAIAVMLGRSGLEYLLRMRAWMTPPLPPDVDRSTARWSMEGDGRGGVGGRVKLVDELVRLLLLGTPVPASAVDVAVVVFDEMSTEEADCAMARTTSLAVLGLRCSPVALSVDDEELVLGLLLCLLLVPMFAEQ